MRKLSNFGQEAFTMVATAAANAGVNAYHAAKVGKLQQKFDKKLDQDELQMAYIRNLILRFETLGTRLARTSRIHPGTPEFEELLKEALKSDMNYKGHCNADIYVPPTATSKAGEPREVWGKINRSGHLEQPSHLPPDVGPIWSSGCKNAQDKFKIAFVDAFKEEKQFRRVKTSKTDIGSMGLLFTYGAGLFLLVVFILSIKMQSAVIRAQKKAKKRTAEKPKVRNRS